jgi:membrane associated rhomboid family serine protease
LQRVLAMQRKLPVTLSLLAANVAFWIAPQILGPGRPALCPSRLMAGFDPPYWSVLFHLVHADDGGWHLCYNMAALAAKGLVLEQSLGSEQFAAMVVLLAIGTSLAYIMLAYARTVLIGVASTYNDCVVGFSGVLFGMSVVVSRSPSVAQRLMVPPLAIRAVLPDLDSKHIVWAELVLASFMQRNVSFVAHLSGLLAGLAYVNREPARERLQLWLSQGDRRQIRQHSHTATLGFSAGDTVELCGLDPPHELSAWNSSKGVVMGRRGVGDQLRYIVLVDDSSDPLHLPQQCLSATQLPWRNRRSRSTTVRGRSLSRGRSPSPAAPSRPSAATEVRRQQDEQYAAAVRADLARQAQERQQQRHEKQRSQDEQRAAHQEELRIGQHVMYTDRAAGTTYTVRIAHIERAVAAGEEPFYTVQMPNGSERQTERGRLRT